MTCNNGILAIFGQKRSGNMNKHTGIGNIWTIFHICFLWKGEDFHLDRELYLACRKDREAVCSEVRLSYVVLVQLEYPIENYESASLLLR